MRMDEVDPELKEGDITRLSQIHKVAVKSNVREAWVEKLAK